MRVRLVAPVLALLAVTAATARAGDHERAVALFREGHALAARGRCVEAIPKLMDTLAIEPSVGALLNLGECHARTGAPELAWKRFREAEHLARQLGDDRESFARAHAEAIEPLMPKLSVGVPPAARGEGLMVRVDDETLAPSDWGVARAIVSGRHVVSASMPGHVAWRATVVTAGQATSTLTVPVLDIAGGPPPPPPPPPPRGSARRTAGIVLTVVGAAGVVAGGVFGGVAAARRSDAAALQTGPSRADFDAARSDARTWATASTVAFIAGAVVLSAGLIVWLTAPSRSRVALALAPRSGGGWTGLVTTF